MDLALTKIKRLEGIKNARKFEPPTIFEALNKSLLIQR
jgi:hypothetical protein